MGSSTSRIQVSQLEQQRFCFRGNPSISQGTIWILSPWQGAAQATRCLCLAVEALHSDNLFSGDRVVARQVAGRERDHLGYGSCLCCNNRALADGLSLTDASLPSSEHGGLLRLASWGTLPRGWTPCREFQRTQSHLFGMKTHHCLCQETGITRSLPFKLPRNYRQQKLAAENKLSSPLQHKHLCAPRLSAPSKSSHTGTRQGHA